MNKFSIPIRQRNLSAIKIYCSFI